MNNNIIQTSAELYREFYNRGLELRKGTDGRDNGLYKELCAKLGCTTDNLPKYLEDKKIPVSVFLNVFWEILEPFSKMYKEIWKYLEESLAKKSLESIKICFDTEDLNNLEDLEAFKRHETIIENLDNVLFLWNDELIRKLFCENFRLEKNNYKKDVDDEDFEIPEIELKNEKHPFDDKLIIVRDLLEYLLKELKGKQEGTRIISDEKESINLRVIYDLMPNWYSIIANYPTICSDFKDKALEFWNKEIEPSLTQNQQNQIEKIREYLDLPFWKHRWHTYEIWSSVIVLKALGKYNPVLNIVNGRLPLDGYSKEKIATLCVSKKGISPTILARYQTLYKNGNRKGINPDIRITYDDNSDDLNNNTACIIEFKQRKELKDSHIKEVSESYLNASKGCKGVIVINYDKKEYLQTEPNMYFFDNVNPSHQSNIEEFQKQILYVLCEADLYPSLLCTSGVLGYTEKDIIGDFFK